MSDIEEAVAELEWWARHDQEKREREERHQARIDRLVAAMAPMTFRAMGEHWVPWHPDPIAPEAAARLLLEALDN